LISGYAPEELVLERHEVLKKPFSRGELLSRVEALLAARAA
jgi:DNA-binding response OmpR family regulator